MYSLIEHGVISILFLALSYHLLDFFHVHKTSRPAIELLLWAVSLWFTISGLWSPVL